MTLTPTRLHHPDLSDNNFNSSDIPSWVYVSSNPNLTTVILKDNQLSGTLNLSIRKPNVEFQLEAKVLISSSEDNSETLAMIIDRKSLAHKLEDDVKNLRNKNETW
ncbi:unnamed protein product [Vicia faba]|uniref:Uncharacterized protein n=1 Tax=Vicia faba TaxID=3906 RepID=A0AAV1AAN4_VICFA|nr:unnamed protein product [Vicia faba]